jgi:hypothetical protein
MVVSKKQYQVPEAAVGPDRETGFSQDAEIAL